MWGVNSNINEVTHNFLFIFIMSPISIQNSVDTDSKIALYTRVFGEAPWNEGYICTTTGNLYSLSSEQLTCICCETPNRTKLFYTPEELQSTFDLLEKKKGYQEQIAMITENNAPVGFMWWWRSSLIEINEDKLKITPEQLENLKANIMAKNESFNLSDFYYFAEIGIEAGNRGSDIAGNLYRAQIEAVIQNGNGSILVRTTKKTDLPYKWFLKIWYIPVFDYNDQQDRVILIKQY